MRDTAPAATDWASARRRRWSASRIAAAILLHALVLVALRLAIDRVEMPRHGTDRATTLVSVALHAAEPPSLQPLPPPRTSPRATGRAGPRSARAVPAPAPTRPLEDSTLPIALPTPPIDAGSTVGAATPPASSPQPDLSFLDNASTRQAIRDAALGGNTLASRANAITRVDQTSGERLAQNIAAAQKGDCGKGEYVGGGMGLLSVPFLVAAEALGNCSSK